MTATLAALWRHLIKGHGRERLAGVTLSPAQTLPWDRTWAVLRDGADDPQGDWAQCNAFTRGAGSPRLMAITAVLDDVAGRITLRHPDRPDITFDPDGDTGAFLDWAAALIPVGRPRPVRVVRAARRGMTDTPFPSISICNTASLAALSDAVGLPLSPDRFRANLWLDGLEAWAEDGLVGRDLRIGGATLRVEMRNTRCRATEANPATGLRDADTLGALRKLWGHIDFGLYATVTNGGTIREGDTVGVA